MNELQVAQLLVLANGHDQRIGTDDAKVAAWFALFQQEAPDIEYGWSESFVKKHYGKTEAMLMPVGLVAGWKEYAQWQRSTGTATGNADAHCGKPSCRCTHGDDCYRGWLERVEAQAYPCPTCRPDLHSVLRELPPPGKRGPADFALVRGRHSHAQSDY